MSRSSFHPQGPALGLLESLSSLVNLRHLGLSALDEAPYIRDAHLAVRAVAANRSVEYGAARS